MFKQRRTFLKISTAGAAGFALFRPSRALAAWPSSGKLDVNPKISNMRVVACYDTAMMKSTPTSLTFANQNAAVDTARLQANMDAMAMQLANVTTPDEAWKTIFRSSKAWSSTRVAIKINTVESRNMARLAVIEKFCRVLAGFGVPAGNIIIYDGNSQYSSAISSYTSYFSATDSSKIPGVVSNVNDALGGTTNAKLPDGSSASCTADIANGKIDILINIANNKGHTLHGGSTLCLKNHFGTFAPNHTNLASYVLNINKSDAIVGGDPVRQQLCFVDSLIANKAQNTGSPESMPCYLIMGTFGGAVDYLTVKKVREAVMNATHDQTIVNNFVTSFGYTTSDPQWVLVPPASASPDAGAGGSGGGGTTGGKDAGGAGAKGTGGSAAGGSGGSGGAGTITSGAGGSGGSGGLGGAGSGGNAKGAGGAGNGGSGSGVSSGGRNGSGGASTPSSSGGSSSGTAVSSGGIGASGGGSAGASGQDNTGCQCRAGDGRKASGSLGIALTLAAVVAGQLRRLFARREILAETDPQEDQPPARKT